jgi:hypothetical protein
MYLIKTRFRQKKKLKGLQPMGGTGGGAFNTSPIRPSHHHLSCFRIKIKADDDENVEQN